MVGTLVSVMFGNMRVESVARKICVATPIAGAIVFGAVYPAGEAAYQHKQAVEAQYDAAKKRCEASHGEMLTVDSYKVGQKSVCLIPTKPGEAKVIYDPGLNL